MNPDNSGGQEKEFEQKLTSIDTWLNTITTEGGSPSPSSPEVFKKTTISPINPPKNQPNQPRRGFKPRPGRSPHPRAPHNPMPFQGKGKGLLRVIPLGGFEEVGKNMMVFEYGNDIVIVDMGFQFPEEDMLGIDYVLPDITYLLERKKNIRGIVLTHGHLDHIGGIAYLLPKLGFPPVYGAPLTIGFVKKQLEEFKLLNMARLQVFDPKEQFRLGAFGLSFFRVNHSIPDAVAVVLDTPSGRVVHTGDFKFDFTPADQRPADFQEIAAVGKRGVMVLVSDSTNSLSPGHTTSEKIIAENLDAIIREAKGRLVITSFSSLIGRLQQIMDSSIKYKRKIFLTGRSMATNIKIAQGLGYIKVPKGVIVDIRALKKFRDHEIIILTTGSQGEDVSALARMAMDSHAQVRIQPGDTVVLSSSPIIGNETAIVKVVNGLCRRGAKVITNREIDVHTSGHAKQEDLKLMIKLIKPKYLIPAHGDLYMRMAHRDLGMVCEIPEKNIFLLDNGEVVAGNNQGEFRKTNEKVPAEYIMVEGPERSEVGGSVLEDRQLMSQNGVVWVTFSVRKSDWSLSKKPTVNSRGFVFMDSSQTILNSVVQASEDAFKQFVQKQTLASISVKNLEDHLHHTLDHVLVRLLDKRPLVVVVFHFV